MTLAPLKEVRFLVDPNLYIDKCIVLLVHITIQNYMNKFITYVALALRYYIDQKMDRNYHKNKF